MNPGGTPQNLKQGENWGNKGGGRPSSAMRAAARDGFDAVITLIQHAIETKQELSLGELSRALDILGKYGLGEQKVILPEELINAIAEVLADDERIPSECIPDVTAKLIQRLGE
jgi:hypothetical protein